jgi:hypothetical protein
MLPAAIFHDEPDSFLIRDARNRGEVYNRHIALGARCNRLCKTSAEVAET